MKNSIIILIGEHPHEVSAYIMGRKVYRNLQEQNYEVFLERMPVQDSLVGSIIRNIARENREEQIPRKEWIRSVFRRHGCNAEYFSFHNSLLDEEQGIEELRSKGLELLLLPEEQQENREFINYHLTFFEIPAVWRPSKNKRWMIYGNSTERQQDQKFYLKEFAHWKEIWKDQLDEDTIKVRAWEMYKEIIEKLKSLDQYLSFEERVAFRISVVDYPSTVDKGFSDDHIVRKIIDRIKTRL